MRPEQLRPKPEVTADKIIAQLKEDLKRVKIQRNGYEQELRQYQRKHYEMKERIIDLENLVSELQKIKSAHQ